MLPGYHDVEVHVQELLEDYKREFKKAALVAETKNGTVKNRRFRKLIGQIIIRFRQKIAAEPQQEGNLI
jgi:hypothetical protein